VEKAFYFITTSSSCARAQMHLAGYPEDQEQIKADWTQSKSPSRKTTLPSSLAGGK